MKKRFQKFLFNLITTKEQRDFIFQATAFSLYTSRRRNRKDEIDKNQPIQDSILHLKDKEQEEENPMWI
jgi:hypothetical protein